MSVKNCNIQIYADDTVISFYHKNVNVIEETLTAEMSIIAKWLDNNRLIINLKKKGKLNQCCLEPRKGCIHKAI